MCHVVQAHVVALEVAGLILKGRGGGGHCSLHCLYSITYQNFEIMKDVHHFNALHFSNLIDLTQYLTYLHIKQITDSGRTSRYYGAILKKDCTQWSTSATGQFESSQQVSLFHSVSYRSC